MVEQTNLDDIFDALKKMLSKYDTSFVEGKVKTDKRQYHLWSKNKISIDRSKSKQVYFAGIIIQKKLCGILLHVNICR